MNEKIERLSDFPALQKLAKALWQQDQAYHGAAVMVGSGFSRSAASTGDANKKLPLWNDLSNVLANDLGDSSVADPLRLAEEYSANFGKQALYDLINKVINDRAWVPGEMHKSLLKLPWSEVLTTNWDSLLERASIEVDQRVYSLVSKQKDLSNRCSPRIVKLHGTVNVTENLIFTQEDYRLYPQTHAAFVNFARQVFIENELCLLGFSGDDPNFLQWAGWVRDHLSDNVRRIYLVGALNLTIAKRKYLESINVTPIDLSALVTDYDDHDVKHYEATKMFLEALCELKPRDVSEWRLTDIDQIDSIDFKVEALRKNREAYPGWLVCPAKERWVLDTELRSLCFVLEPGSSTLSSEVHAKLLYEISWRYGVTYRPIANALAQKLLNICDPQISCGLTKKQQMQIALLLLKNTRWFDSTESQEMEQKTTDILKNNVKYWPKSTNEVALHQAILARNKFKYSTFEKIVEGICPTDSEWKLKKASLLAEIGKFEEGKLLITEAHLELLDQYRNDRNSIYVLSRLAWARWLLPSEEYLEFPSDYTKKKCDPWSYFKGMKDSVSKALTDQQKKHGITPSFEPGRYRDNSATITFSNVIPPCFVFEGISETSAIPLRWEYTAYLVDSVSKLVELNDLDGAYLCALAIRAADNQKSDVLNKVFSRTKIACLDQNKVDALLIDCMQSIEYWLKCRINGKKDVQSFSLGRLQVFVEVLARLSVRATPERASQILIFALELFRNTKLHHIWLIDSLTHLLDYSLESIPPHQQQNLLLEALLFPLQNEISGTFPNGWPNPLINLPGNRCPNADLDRRISEIIEKIEPCTTQSAPALVRLWVLHEQNFLTPGEQQKISDKLWGSSPNCEKIPKTGLLVHVLLGFPNPDASVVKKTVRAYLFEAEGEKIFSEALLSSISSVALNKRFKEFPNEVQAIDYFERLISWRPRENVGSIFGPISNDDKEIAKLIGETLAYSIVPSLPVAYLTEEKFEKLLLFFTEVEVSSALVAFPYFARNGDVFSGRVEKLVREGLLSQDANVVAYSSFALLRWRELEETQAIERLILRLVYLVGSNRKIGLTPLISTVNQMYEKNFLSRANLDSLIETIPVIFDSTDYRAISSLNSESIDFSLVRAACVKFVRDILSREEDITGELNRVLEEARGDALPEVRLAALDEM